MFDLCSPVWFLRSSRNRKHNVLTAGVRPSCSPHQGMSSTYHHPVVTQITTVFFQPWSSRQTVLHVLNLSPRFRWLQFSNSLLISRQLKSGVLKQGNRKLSGQSDQSWKNLNYQIERIISMKPLQVFIWSYLSNRVPFHLFYIKPTTNVFTGSSYPNM